jgi:hypothetical protein
LHKQKIVGEIFCNLKKAFESVNHEILLNKFQFHGIVGKFHGLITSYLTKRCQCVLIASTDLSNTSSSWNTETWSPAGSILAPLIFLFYINDLPPNLDNSVKPVLFADDISLVISSCNEKQYKGDVNGSTACLNYRFKSNLLTSNFNKT